MFDWLNCSISHLQEFEAQIWVSRYASPLCVIAKPRYDVREALNVSSKQSIADRNLG
jgi:hypothetical protein